MSDIRKICAVIVSYNRPVLLKETIESVLAQSEPCDILIIDNASDADTHHVIRAAQATHSNIIAMFLDKNIGGAGGFHEGLKEAWRLGYDGFWLLDDDAIAEDGALRALVAARATMNTITGHPPAFVCSNVRWIDGSACKINVPVLNATSWLNYACAGAPYLPVRYASFVSLLVSRETVRQHGLPLKEYFIWFDDSEYTHRISQGNEGILSLDSVVIHKTADNINSSITLATEQNLWKHEYGSRNKSSFLYKSYGKIKYIKNLKKVFIDSIKANISWRSRWKLIYATAIGIKFSPPIEYVVDAEIQK